MTTTPAKGQVYRCPVCGAELSVLADRAGDFAPVCCSRPMEPQDERLAFYVCPVCGAEIGVVHAGESSFRPRCCDTEMRLDAA